MKNATKITYFKDKTLRNVVQSILYRDLSKIKNKKILEIGCGNWDYAKKILENNDNEWHGFEPVDFGKNNLTIIKGSVKSIPYHENSFDYVICNQTIEHWFEYAVSFRRALNEIKRVLNPKGVLIVNAPIHIHGHPIFLKGKLKKIMKLFTQNWEIKLFEKCFSSKKEKRWKQLGTQGWQSKIGYPSFLIPDHKNAFSYILNIHAMRKSTRKPLTKRAKFREIKVFIRFIKENITDSLGL